MDSPIPDFNRTQLHVMQILWAADDALKPSEIEERFDWPIENATLRSVLVVMIERGDIVREKRGKAYHYAAGQEKGSVMGNLLSGLAKVFGSDSRVGLFAQLLEEEQLTDEERAQLQRIAESLPGDTTTTNEKKK